MWQCGFERIVGSPFRLSIFAPALRIVSIATFRGGLRRGPLSIRFLASDDDGRDLIASNPYGQNTISGGVGTERNGVFFQ